jgi:hypothetical protein
MRVRSPLRVLVSAAVVAAAAVSASLVTAGPASALSVCASETPPDWCFSPPAAPSAPTGLRATAILQTSVSLVWNQLGSLPISVTRTVNGTTTTVRLAGGTTSYTDPQAPAGASITYALFGTDCNRYGCTDGAAATLTITTHPLGTDPVGSASGAVLNYYNAPPNPDDRVWYTMTGWALDYDTTAAIQVQLLSDGQPTGSPITASGTSTTNTANPGYGDAHGFNAGYLRKATGKGNHTTCAVAVNVGGGTNTTIGCFTYYVPGPPAAATSVKPLAGPTSVTITFTDNANDEDGYYLQRSTDGGTNWLQVGGFNPPVPGVNGTGKVIDSSIVGPGVCYQILEQNKYGQSLSTPGCTP